MSGAFTDTLIEQFPTPVLCRQCRDVSALNNALALLIRDLRNTELNAAPGSSTRGGYQTDTNFLYRDHVGVYYVEVPELSRAESEEDAPGGSLVFLDPRSSANMYRLSGHRQLHSHLPRAGSLVVFPSYHMHAVFPYQSSGERISVAFNARLTLT